jgi:type I restriction enzyme, S subunit
MKNVALLKPNPKILDSLFLLHLHQSRKDRIAHVVRSGGAQPFLSLTELKKLPILLPPLPEQRRIAEILSTWDRAIETVEALIANARAQKKALMQSLLTGKHRLPGFSGDWVSRAFGSFAESEKRRIDPKALTSAAKCVELEHIQSETGALLGFCDARAQASLKSVFEPGYILYGKLRPYLRKFYRPDFSGVCSTEIWSIKANEKTCLSDFLYHLIQSSTFEEAVDVSSGSKMPRADWGIVKGTTFHLPSLNEQRAICDLLDTAESELNYSQQQLTALRQEKSALMQQLLTGKRRVRVDLETEV